MEYYNRARVSGRIREPLLIRQGEPFVRIEITRNSGILDFADIVFGASLPEGLAMGDRLAVSGFLCASDTEGGGLLVCIVPERTENDAEDCNELALSGALCRRGALRSLRSGRMICSFTLVQGKNHIPCVGWGEDAKRVARAKLGANIKLSGRLQSRIYQKDGRARETFEVCCINIDLP